jgi:hypothetical protein
LSDAEQEDLSDRFLQLPKYSSQRTWLMHVVPMLRQYSAGHVGLFRVLLQRLDEFPTTLGRPASVETVCAFYFGRIRATNPSLFRTSHAT